MDKPLTIAQRDFKDALIRSINSSGLPALVLIPVLERALEELRQIDEAQYQADLKAIEEAGRDE